MQYMILIHGEESTWATMPPAEAQAAFASYMAYNQELVAAGVMRGGGQLKPTHTATTVRVRSGAVQLTDGPFAETKEQFGGYYLIEVADLDAALAWAAKCPGALVGSVEVRPIMYNPAP